MKGIFAAIVVLSHIRGTTTSLNGTIIGMMLTAAGYLSVGYFFFISGYGLSYQCQKKQKYLHNFPEKRILNFYVKYLIVTLVYACVKIAQTGTWRCVLSWRNVVFLDVNIANGWYLQAIMLVYLLFYFIWQIPRLKNLAKSCLLFTIYLVVVPLIAENITLYYASSGCLFVGLVLPLHRDKIHKIVESHFIATYIILFMLFCAMVLLGNIHVLSETGTLLCKMVSAPAFVFFVVLTTRFIPVQNGITRFLGKYSFGIYVLHGLFMDVFRPVISSVSVENYLIYGVAVFLCTIIASLLLHYIYNLVDNIRRRNYKKNSSG